MPPNSEYLDEAYKRYREKKTHVSFPQLKYPSLRDQGFKDPVQWLMGKAMDDGAEGLWRIHDKLYDFETFMADHPGGIEWFELTKGTDITEAFESHHLNPIVDQMKDKYYVKDATTPRNSPLTFKEDGFYKTLKKIVFEEMRSIPKNVTKYSDWITDGLLVALFVAGALTCWAKDPYIVNASYLVASYALCSVVIASHNYIHRRANWRMYLFSLSCWSYRDFRISHALSHHMYPNLANDLEVSGFEPIVFWAPSPDKPFYCYLTFLIECLVFPLAFLMNFTKKFILNFVRKDFFRKHYRWHDFLGFLLPVWMWLVTGVTVSEAFYQWIWINCTGSLFFFTIGSNAAHHHPDIFKDGDEVESDTRDWGIHEVDSLMDRCEMNSSHYRVMTFFGQHALHHLFPTLDHAYLPYLFPKFQEHCKKYKANFRLTNQLDLFIGQIKCASKKEFNTLKKDE